MILPVVAMGKSPMVFPTIRFLNIAIGFAILSI